MQGAHVRVAAALFDQKPVYFDIDAIEPWQRHPRRARTAGPPRVGGARHHHHQHVVTIVCALVLARRNLLQGHADRRGAVSLALYSFHPGRGLNPCSAARPYRRFREEYSLLAGSWAFGLYWSALTAVLSSPSNRTCVTGGRPW